MRSNTLKKKLCCLSVKSYKGFLTHFHEHKSIVNDNAISMYCIRNVPQNWEDPGGKSFFYLFDWNITSDKLNLFKYCTEANYWMQYTCTIRAIPQQVSCSRAKKFFYILDWNQTSNKWILLKFSMQVHCWMETHI